MAKPSLQMVGFVGFCLVSILAAVVYVIRARMNLNQQPEIPQYDGAPASIGQAPAKTQAIPAAPANSLPAGAAQQAKAAQPEVSAKARHLLFRSTALDDNFGRLGYVPLNALSGARTLTNLRCERIHFAGGRGVCLFAERGVITTHGALVFNDQFQPQQQIALRGIPSRVRVAPNGEVAAITVFVSGHGYGVAGFSTHTTFVSLKTGQPLVDNMEKFRVLRDGERFHEADFNFWGVTFARDSNRFYATLGSGGRTYVVEGDLRKLAARVLRGDVECPSLSPDNTRIGFKKRFGGVLSPVTWRLSVLDLKSLEDRLLAETRSVDDQVEWLDNDNVLYALSDATTSTAATDAWSAPATGSGEAKLVLPKAYSPVVMLK